MTDDHDQARYHTQESADLSWFIARLLLTIDVSQAREGDPVLDEAVSEALLTKDYKSLWGAQC